MKIDGYSKSRSKLRIWGSHPSFTKTFLASQKGSTMKSAAGSSSGLETIWA